MACPSGVIARGSANGILVAARAGHGAHAGGQASMETSAAGRMAFKHFHFLVGSVNPWKWFASVSDLRSFSQVTRELCRTYRALATVHLTLDDSNVDHFKRKRRQVVLRPKALTWKAATLRLNLALYLDLGGVKSLTVGNEIGQGLRQEWFSRGFPELENMTLAAGFDQSITDALFPNRLKSLTFGPVFNQSIAGVAWPESLEQLTFGRAFDQSVAGDVLPRSLKEVTFGRIFNNPLAGVVWPPTLKKLTFGHHFNQPIAGVVWPPTLEQLVFGYLYNQPIIGTSWPGSLKQLEFGWAFDQVLSNVPLPPALESLFFHRSGKFNKPLQYLDYPHSIRHLRLGGLYQLSVQGPWLSQSPLTSLGLSRWTTQVDQVSWPQNLTDVSLGGLYVDGLYDVTFPASLLRMEFWWSFNQSLVGIAWPANLEELHFRSCDFNRSLVEDQVRDSGDVMRPVTLPGSVHTLSFGESFDQSLRGIKWPASLTTLSFGGKLEQDIVDVAWPASLRRVTLPGPERPTPIRANGETITWHWT